MSNGAEIVADALMDSLLVGEVFTVPTVNLNDPAFNFPSIVGNPLYNAVTELTNEDLTTRTVGGTGTYDAIMASQAAHLKDEFNQGRITGAEYTKAYIALAQAAAGQAIQFLLGKDQAYWASVIAQGQALTAKVQLETAKVQLAISLVEMNNQRATFALNKIRLANEDAQYGITKYNLDNLLPAQLAMANAQKTGQDTSNSIATYNLTTALPAQTAQTTAQTANITAEGLNIPKQGVLLTNQAAQVTQQTSNLLSENANIGKQGLQIEAQTALSGQQRINLVSEELNISKQGTVLTNQGLQIAQQTLNLVSEELSIDARTTLTTQQKANLTAEALNIPKQGTLLDAQKLGVEKSTESATYTLTNILPKQAELILEQAQVQRAQTSDTRSDLTAVAGSVKSQKDLYAQQVISYQRSSQVNAAKIFTDAWVADSAIQDSPIVPAAFSSANISSVLSSIKTINGL